MRVEKDMIKQIAREMMYENILPLLGHSFIYHHPSDHSILIHAGHWKTKHRTHGREKGHQKDEIDAKNERKLKCVEI